MDLNIKGNLAFLAGASVLAGAAMSGCDRATGIETASYPVPGWEGVNVKMFESSPGEWSAIIRRQTYSNDYPQISGAPIDGFKPEFLPVSVIKSTESFHAEATMGKLMDGRWYVITNAPRGVNIVSAKGEPIAGRTIEVIPDNRGINNVKLRMQDGNIYHLSYPTIARGGQISPVESE